MIRVVAALRFAVVTCVVGVVVVIADVDAQVPSLSAGIIVHTDDTTIDARAALSIMELSETLPKLAKIRSTMTNADVQAVRANVDKLGQAYYSVKSLPPIIQLDTIGRWLKNANPHAQAVWLLDKNAVSSIGLILLQLVGQHRLISEVEQFVTAIEKTSALTVLHVIANDQMSKSIADELVSMKYVLIGHVALVSGDTVQAGMALLKVARNPLTSWARSATDTLITVTAARRDTAQLLSALTLGYLQSGGSDDGKKKARYYKRLEQMYSTFVNTHGSLGDVVPGALTDTPAVPKSLPLDIYLDRQFTALYERAFPVARAAFTTKKPGEYRAVVAEYVTGVGCGGCWNEDRAFHAVTRRYRPEQVITLAYHGHYLDPVSNYADSSFYRFFAWYPNPFARSIFFRGKASSILPAWTVIGDTKTNRVLNGVGWINGRRLSGWEDSSNKSLPNQIYEEAVERIDSILPLAPKAIIHVSANRRGGQVVVTVNVDSVHERVRLAALRIVLFEDTVRVRGATIRRLYQNVVRGVAQTETMSLGLPLRTRGPSSTQYVFDLFKINAQLAKSHDPKVYEPYWRDGVLRSARLFPDIRDWRMDTNRLHIVAFVQDLDTGEVLQAVRTRVPPDPVANVH